MKIGIYWDELYPLFGVDKTDFAEAYAEVTTEWMEEYNVIAARFWQMQDELAELAGYDGYR